MKLVKIMNNFHLLSLTNVDVYYSYETPIAFIDDNNLTLISNNEWGVTTGKHINYVKRNTEEYKQIPHNELIQIIQLHI